MLPEYWYLKTDSSSPLWTKFNSWMEKQTNGHGAPDYYKYVGYDGRDTWIAGYNVWDRRPAQKKRYLQYITLEEWESMLENTSYTIY